MAVVCPTVTAYDTHEYRQQMERIASFAERIHVDLMDGEFAPTTSPTFEQLWWDDSEKIDLHIMYKKPTDHIEEIIRLSPSLVIVHAEAEGQFVELAQELHQHGIKVGVSLLKDTHPDKIKPAIEHIDHVLIFSGELGHFGGQADLSLLEKVSLLKSWKLDLEIGWDGGINDRNAAALVDGGVDVLNVGGFIQKAEEPKKAYAKLKAVIK